MTAESNSLKSYCFFNSVRRRYKLAFAASRVWISVGPLPALLDFRALQQRGLRLKCRRPLTLLTSGSAIVEGVRLSPGGIFLESRDGPIAVNGEGQMTNSAEVGPP